MHRSPRKLGSTDRSRRHVAIVAGLALVVTGLAACQPPVLSLTVTTAVDGADLDPGDGACAIAGGGCSLRAAIDEANETAGFDRITIAAGIDPVLSRAGQVEDANSTGDLDVTGDLEIRGQGATIDAGGLDRILDVRSGTVTLSDATVTGGVETTAGRAAGIRSFGTTTLARVRVVDNGGAGVAVEAGTFTLRDSEVAGEVSGPLRGQVLVGAGQLNLIRSLIDAHDQAIYAFGTSRVVLLDSTVHTDQDGLTLAGSDTTGLVYRSTLATEGTVWGNFVLDVSPFAELTIAGSVLDARRADPSHEVCWTPVTSDGYNVASDASCELGAEGDVEGVAASLGPLAANGGPTRTLLPYLGSPAVDLIPADHPLCSTSPVDQRGIPRPEGEACDAGAVEGAAGEVGPIGLVVDVATDDVDLVPGDGICLSASGGCTLRAAVMEANAANAPLPGVEETISIDPGIDPVLSLVGAGEDLAATGDIDITGSLVIEGGGATIDAAALDRVFDSTAPRVGLRDMTITGGEVVGDGGGVRSTIGVVDFDGVSLVDNHASGTGGGLESSRMTARLFDAVDNTAGGAGGALRSDFADIDRSTIADNVSGDRGGGAEIGQSGSVRASTVSGNSAVSSGGGLSSILGGGGVITVTNSTLVGNQAPVASAIHSLGLFDAGLRMFSSTVAGNTGGPALVATAGFCTRACYSWDASVVIGSILVGGPSTRACDAALSTASHHNLAPEGTCGATLPGSADLGALGLSGGPTATLVPGSGSGAVDAIAPGTAVLCDGSVPTDQRGVSRPVGAGCDVGAVEQ